MKNKSNIKTKVALKLETPTNELVQKYVQKLYSNERYYLEDQAVAKLFQHFPKNESVEDIILKISALNDLYGTNIFATYKMAKHIQKLKVDKYFDKKDLSVVGKIAVGHGIGDRNFYSFATKYCSWHDKDTYPIYDTFVQRILTAYRKQDKFSQFVNSDLRNYKAFAKVISDFKQKYSLTQHNLKEIDKFLWAYGKEKFPSGYKAE